MTDRMEPAGTPSSINSWDLKSPMLSALMVTEMDISEFLS
jgi:hypothetical protein